MATFLSRLRTLTAGAAHDLLDKVIDMNSPSMLRQYLRELEDAIGRLNGEAASQQGLLLTLRREQGDLQEKIAADKTAIAKLLTTPAGQARATAMAATVLQEQKQLDQKNIDLASQRKAADDLAGSVQRVQVKHDQMLARVRELERLDRETKAKEKTASALSAAGALASSVSSPSVDDLETRMRQRHDMATARFDQAMGTLPPEETADPDEVAALLASLTPAAK